MEAVQEHRDNDRPHGCAWRLEMDGHHQWQTVERAPPGPRRCNPVCRAVYRSTLKLAYRFGNEPGRPEVLIWLRIAVILTSGCNRRQLFVNHSTPQRL
jgi:hypothetical protein